MSHYPNSHSWSDKIEETLIAVILGVMTLLTFANVVARYGFNSNIFYALEMTVFLFALSCPGSSVWTVYEFGVGGRKAAKLFSSHERNLKLVV